MEEVENWFKYTMNRTTKDIRLLSCFSTMAGRIQKESWEKNFEESR